MSSTDSLRKQLINLLISEYANYPFAGNEDHIEENAEKIMRLIKQYGLEQRIDELALNLRHVGHTECSEYGVGIVYSTKERLAELERKKEEL